MRRPTGTRPASRAGRAESRTSPGLSRTGLRPAIGWALVVVGLLAACGSEEEGATIPAERVRQELRGAVEAATGAVSTHRRLLLARAWQARAEVTSLLGEARARIQASTQASKRPTSQREALLRAIDQGEAARQSLDVQLEDLRAIPVERWSEIAQPLAHAVERVDRAGDALDAALELDPALDASR